MTESDLYYLRSILGHLREFRTMIDKDAGVFKPSIGTEILADNIDWLDSSIEVWTRVAKLEETQ